MAAVTVYCCGYAIEVTLRDLESITSAVKLEYVGASLIPTFWIIFAVRYTGVGWRLPVWLEACLPVLSAVICALVFTNDLHHLYFATTGIGVDGPFPAFVFTRGPAYYLGYAYFLSCAILGIALFGRMLVVAPAGKRIQALVMLFGSLIPGVLSTLDLLALTPQGIDLSALAFSISGLLWALGLFRYHLFDVVPVALDAIFRAMRDGVVILDHEGRVAELNERAGTVLQGMGPPRARVLLRESLASRPDLVERIEREPDEPKDVMIEVNGEQRHFDLRVSLVRDKGGGIVGKTIVLVDTTERVRLMEEMRRLAVTDELTGLHNRRQFMEHARIEMDRARRTGRPVSAVAVDMDHFKRVNDAHGHAAGDAVLKGVSALWKGMLRATDVLGRCGGEEFMLLLPDAPLDMAVLVAERLRVATEALLVDAGALRLRITASFGVSCREERDGSDPAGLLARADAALYDAKAGGRNQVRVSSAV
jgi:diguanylate cyclase (GGDEF)-like protein